MQELYGASGYFNEPQGEQEIKSPLVAVLLLTCHLGVYLCASLCYQTFVNIMQRRETH